MASDVQGSSVLVVDDAPENLRALCGVLRRGGLVPRPVTSGRRAIEAAAFDPPELMLLDIQMPEMSGIEVCRWFKQDERLKGLPIIFISGFFGSEEKVAAFRAGGVDYISKPFAAEEVLARVNTHLRLQRIQGELLSQNHRLEERISEQVKAVTASQLATISALAKLAETRDDNTGRHIERVQLFSRRLAQRMREMSLYASELTPSFVDTLSETASLHDIGKVGTPDAILLKPGKLTTAQFSEMKKHCTLGANTLSAVLERHPANQFLRMGIDVARSHHERWDGTGYPDGLAGVRIPLSARIVALADFYDALTSRRCYRSAFSHDETTEMIHQGDGAHFDPDVVSAFRSQEAEFRAIRTQIEHC